MKNVLLISAVTAVVAILGIKVSNDRKRDREILRRLNWLHGRMDRMDVMAERFWDEDAQGVL